MKARIGFVSNSSSSSFILAYKEKTFEESFDKSITVDYSFLDEIVKDIKICLSENIRETFTKIRDFVESEEYENIDDVNKDKIIDLLSKGFTVGVGSTSDEGTHGKIDFYLTHKEIDFENDILYIYKEESY